MNATDAPIACTLNPAEVPERMAEIAALGADALASARVNGSRAVLRFNASAGTRQRLAAIVAAESNCCAFLTMHMADEGNAIVLTIEGPVDAEPVLRELVAGFAPANRAGT